MRKVSVFAAVLLATLAVVQPLNAAVVGEQRVLLTLVTWGPQPWTREEARAAFDAAASYTRSASYGKTWLVGDVTPWTSISPRPSTCDLTALERAGRAAATAAGFDPTRYTQLGFAFPDIDCPWSGAYFGLDVWANGRLDDALLEHELGHIYGNTEEGPAWVCEAGRCESANYQSPYSVMGHGVSDYNAFEKYVFGWLTPTLARAAGIYTIEPLERSPSALRVLTAGDEYWFEYRSAEPPPWPFPELPPASGVVVHAGSSGLSDTPGRFSSRDLFLPDPAHKGRHSLLPGDSFSVAGAFTVAVTALDGQRASVELTWTDRTRPRAPRILGPGAVTRARAVEARWTPARDNGSGVAAYEVSLDGRRVATVAAIQDLGSLLVPTTLARRLPRLAPGTHRLAIAAVDRAGNRGASAVRRFRILR